MTISVDSPQNPYESYLVEASAGSGKTYQLSRRFLYLVGAGVNPGNILTITFTVKAAGEMRARILEDAAKLLVSEQLQRDFDSSLAIFYDHAKSLPQYSNAGLRQPRTAIEAAKAILSSTQMLKISTIDSLFNQWVAKFPWESGIDDHGKNQLPAPFRIMDALDDDVLSQKAWNEVFAQINQSAINAFDILAHYEEDDSGPLNIIKKIEQLDKQNTYLWKLRNEGFREVYGHSKPSSRGIQMFPNEQDLIAHLQTELTTCARVTGNPEELYSAIATGSIRALVDCKLLTKGELKVSGAKIRGNKREQLASTIATIDQAFADFRNEEKIDRLNKCALALYQIYTNWTTARESLKNTEKFIEFTDLSKGAYRLFNRPDGLGATWLIQKSVRHLMLDEFQDTSLLQWSIFKKLTEELLSGQGNCDIDGIGSSVFIVGDSKQSIYGFREGDPIVLAKARETFRDFDKREVPLDRSYRTAQLLLDVINQYFSRHPIDGFRPHETAIHSDGRPFIPNCGRVAMKDLFTSKDDDPISAREKEAEFVAKSLAFALKHREQFPVYDKKTGTFRPLTPSDCCILYRSSTHVELFEDALRTYGIPCRKAERKGFFSRQEIQDVLALFSFLQKPADSLSLVTVLKSPLSLLSDRDVIELIEHTSESNDAGIFTERLQISLRSHFPDIADSVDRTLVAARQKLPHEILLAAYRNFNAIDRYRSCFQGAEGDLAVNNLLKLVELCCELESRGFTSISACLARLRKMAVLDEHGSSPTANQAVTLMTIHKSKGLEFPYVVIIDLGSDWYKTDPYWMKSEIREQGIAYVGTKSSRPTDDPQFDEIIQAQRNQLRAEAERLLYVALTRASHYLLLTGSKPRKGGQDAFFSTLWQSLESQVSDKALIDGCLAIETRQQFSCEGYNQSEIREPFPATLTVESMPGELPAEIEVVQPSAHDDDAEHLPSHRIVPPPDPFGIVALLGTTIHRSLESSWGQGTTKFDLIWNQEFVAKLFPDQRKEIDLDAIRSAVEKEVQATLNAPDWRQLASDAIKIVPEMEVVMMKGNQLVRGTMDLCIHYENGSVLIIDYKTAHYCPIKGAAKLETLNSREQIIELRNFCIDKGYHRQLKLYEDAAKLLYPGHKVSSAIWLTKLQRLVPIFP